MTANTVAPENALSATGGLRRLSWRALGTTCEVQYACTDGQAARDFEAEAVGWVAAFESRYSRYRPDSIVSRINASAGGDWVEVDAETDDLLAFCGDLYTLTHGVLDVTAGPLMRLWNYQAAEPCVPADDAVESARRLVGWGKVERRPGAVRLPERGMSLDFGGWGKEYAVDAVAAIARSRGIASALIDFGHDLAAVGAAPGKPGWHVGLENPVDPAGPCLGSLAIADAGVASSGDYLRGFTSGGVRYGHIVDPRTGRPVGNGCRQATVVAPGCLLAGALSTAIFILGPEAGLRLAAETPGVEARVVTSRATHHSRGFFRHVVS